MAKKIKLPKNKTKERIHLFDYDDVLNTASAKLPHIELFSNKKVLVEKCKGINEYNNETVCINIGEKGMIFHGKNLQISSLESKNVVITGEIDTINFIE